MSNTTVLKTAIMTSLDDLPAASLETLAEFTSFLQAKSREHVRPRIVRLGGLWSGVPTITSDDIAEAREEMWGSLGNREV